MQHLNHQHYYSFLFCTATECGRMLFILNDDGQQSFLVIIIFSMFIVHWSKAYILHLIFFYLLSFLSYRQLFSSRSLNFFEFCFSSSMNIKLYNTIPLSRMVAECWKLNNFTKMWLVSFTYIAKELWRFLFSWCDNSLEMVRRRIHSISNKEGQM